MKHKITNFNIIDERVEDNIKMNYPDGLEICYTDPPWGSGNLKYWSTQNKKQTNNDTTVISQEELEDRFIYLITKYVKNYAFIVYGKREFQSCVEKLKKYKNVKNIQVYSKKYKSGTKWLDNVIICVTLNQANIIDWSDLQNLKGIDTLYYVCEKFKNKYKTCLELFVGIGCYLKILDMYNYEVCGNELNAERLRKALSKIK